jgi:hypothetical protein
MKVNVPSGMVVSLFAQALIVRRHLSGLKAMPARSIDPWHRQWKTPPHADLPRASHNKHASRDGYPKGGDTYSFVFRKRSKSER